MAQINSLSTAVGSLLGITLSSSTNPTITEVQDWLLKGAKEFILQMPLRRLERLYSEVSHGSSGKSFSPSNMLRLASAYDPVSEEGYEVVHLEIGKRFPEGSDFTPYYTWVSGGDTININIGDVETSEFQIIVTPTGTTDWPDIFEEAIIEFALAKAKIPETDYAAWQVFYSDWKRRLQTIEEIGEL